MGSAVTKQLRSYHILFILDPGGQTLEVQPCARIMLVHVTNISCFGEKQLSQPQTHLPKSALAQRPGKAISIFHDLYLVGLDVPIIQLKLVHYLQKHICQILFLLLTWCRDMGTSRSAVTPTFTEA